MRCYLGLLVLVGLGIFVGLGVLVGFGPRGVAVGGTGVTDAVVAPPQRDNVKNSITRISAVREPFWLRIEVSLQ